MSSEIDEAFKIAANDPAQAHVFFDAFLNADLYFPVIKEGATDGTWKELQEEDKFQPLFVRQDQTQLVTVFDSLDRLKVWAGEKELDYIVLKGYVLLQIIGETVEVALNVGVDSEYHFTIEKLNQVRKAMKPVSKPMMH